MGERLGVGHVSISVVTDVHCDGKCGKWTPGIVGTRAMARHAREAARSRGWTREGDEDFCPDCTAKRRAGKPKP